METSKHYYRVDRRQINIVKFIFEAYEGIAAVTTLDPSLGWIMVASAPGCEHIVRNVMLDLGEHFLVEHADAPTGSLVCNDE